MKSLQACVVVALLVSLAIPGFAQDSPPENWPEFRGGTDGQAIGAKVPLEIGKKEFLNWKTPIHGKGWSSPVIWGDQIWLTTATEDGKKMSALCVSLSDGKVIRDKVIHENNEPAFCHPTNSYASPTPAIEEGRVYLHFGSYGTTCLDTKTGDRIWQRKDLECDHFRGPASSPIIFKNLLIVAYDGADQQYVVGLNKETGETVWKTEREIDYGTEEGDWMKAYCTGAIFEVNDKPLLVYPSASATIAYDPSNGKPVWTAYHGGMNASARPVMTANGLVILTNGMGKMVAVDPKGEGNVTESHIKWMFGDSVARKSSQLIIGEHIYMVSDKGIATCLDQSGEKVWQERIGGKFATSPVFDGEKIMALSENGTVHFFKPGTKYEALVKSRLADGFKASPAFSGNRVVLRSFSTLYCISAK